MIDLDSFSVAKDTFVSTGNAVELSVLVPGVDFLKLELPGMDEPFSSYFSGSLRKESSHCVITFISFREVPHGTQGTNPEIVTRSA